jgi:hypothetical protein
MAVKSGSSMPVRARLVVSTPRTSAMTTKLPSAPSSDVWNARPATAGPKKIPAEKTA